MFYWILSELEKYQLVIVLIWNRGREIYRKIVVNFLVEWKKAFFYADEAKFEIPYPKALRFGLIRAP